MVLHLPVVLVVRMCGVTPTCDVGSADVLCYTYLWCWWCGCVVLHLPVVLRMCGVTPTCGVGGADVWCYTYMWWWRWGGVVLHLPVVVELGWCGVTPTCGGGVGVVWCLHLQDTRGGAGAGIGDGQHLEVVESVQLQVVDRHLCVGAYSHRTCPLNRDTQPQAGLYVG